MEQSRPSIIRMISRIGAAKYKLANDGTFIIYLKSFQVIPEGMLKKVQIQLTFVAQDGSEVIRQGTIQEAVDANRTAYWYAYQFQSDHNDLAQLFQSWYPHNTNVKQLTLIYQDTVKQIPNLNFQDPSEGSD